MKYFTKEVQIALVAIAGVVVLFFGLQFLKGLSLLGNSNTYPVSFTDISGLSASSPVYANGYKVGAVKSIEYNYDGEGKIVAFVELDKEMMVPKGSHAEISSDFMGNVKMNLILSSNPLERLAPGDTIPGGQSNGLMEKAGARMPTVEQILPKIDSILTNLNALLADPALMNTLHHVDHLSANLETSSRQMNQLMATLNYKVPTMLNKADGILENTQQFTGQLNSIDVAATMNKVNETLNNVDQLSAKLNSKESTIGLLMNDPTLYHHLTATMGSADSLLIDLRQHPKRYVHFSLFGKKDK